MKPLGIRNRILLAALAPAALVAILISSVFVVGQMEQAQDNQHQRLGALARQLSATAEYNLFSGNVEGLRGQLHAALTEPDVMAAAILDTHGKLLASTVPAATLPEPGAVVADFDPILLSEDEQHWHSNTIRATHYGEDDLFSGQKVDPAPALGQLLLKVSNHSLNVDLQRQLFVAAITTLFVLIVGLLLALLLSRNLIRILSGIGRVVEGIGQGETHLRLQHLGTDELGRLAEGINEMAAAVGQTREELAQRVEQATITLRRERDEAEAAGRARGRFFAAASHDLRQPLQALGLFIARLEREAQQSELLPQVHKVAQAVYSLQSLLDTLLDYSRLDGLVYRVEQRPVRAADVIAHVADEFAEAALDKHLALRIRVTDCWLMTDPGLLHRILLNLLGNAVRHTQSGGILFACRRGATHARIEVWDTGPGIPVEAQAAIFDELVQLDNPERDAAKGLGLGLSIVRRTADLLEHPLGLCSRVGQGSRFSIAIPLAVAPAAWGSEKTAQADSDDPLERAQILVIGKPEPSLEELAGMLEDWGCQIIIVGNVDLAKSWIEGHGVPHLLLWNTEGGAAGCEEALVLLDWLETASGYLLPAIVVSSGPAPQPTVISPGHSLRLLLPRPFRPARLRALITHALQPQNVAEAATTLAD